MAKSWPDVRFIGEYGIDKSSAEFRSYQQEFGVVIGEIPELFGKIQSHRRDLRVIARLQ